MAPNNSVFNNPKTLYYKLKTACRNDWKAYCYHKFVQGLADGSLPLASFKHYLQQDYLFLIHFARAYALAVVKADNLDDMRTASASAQSILKTEMNLHLSYCSQWGITEQSILQQPEATATTAYTRYVIDKGVSGDILDLYTALSPCAIGYAEIGQRLIHATSTIRDNNPYLEWIQVYGGNEFLESAMEHINKLEQLALNHFHRKRLNRLCKIFQTATCLETEFWEMGLKYS